MAVHAIYLDAGGLSGDRITVEGEEARHALRVKRVREGDVVRVLDGCGGVAECRVIGAGRSLELEVIERRAAAPTAPAVHVYSATPKGPRLDQMIDELSQAGAASWRPLGTKLGVVDPGEGKTERARRIAREASKQSQRAWVMRIEAKAALQEALSQAEGEAIIVADGSGAPYRATGAAAVRLLVGPEGGWTEAERAAARAAGAVFASFGPHVMRIETAAVVGTGVILSAEAREGSVKPGWT